MLSPQPRLPVQDICPDLLHDSNSYPDIDSDESFGTSSTSTHGSRCDKISEITDFSVAYGTTRYILVVGGLGFIGSHTAFELAKAGYNVVIIDDLSNSFPGVFHRLETLVDQFYQNQNYARPQLHFHEANYHHESSLRSIISKYHLGRPESAGQEYPPDSNSGSIITGVIQLAGHKAIGESISNPLKYYANNVRGLIDFCLVLQEFDIKTMLFSSSSAVYGDIVEIETRLREEDAPHERTTIVDVDGHERTVTGGSALLLNPYGRTKWMGESILSDLASSDPEWKIFALRYFNTIGCDESGMLWENSRCAPSSLMPAVVQVMNGKRSAFTIFGGDYNTKDGTTVRDFIHVTDVARGHIAALEASSKNSYQGGFRVFNLGTGEGHSVLDVVSTMEEVYKKSIPVQIAGRREGDIGICIADTRRAENELGWKAEKTLASCCRDILHSLEKQRSTSLQEFKVL